MFLIRDTRREDIDKICKIMCFFPDSYHENYVNSIKRGGVKWLLRYAIESKDKYDIKLYVMEKNKQIIGHIAYYKDVRCFQGGVYEMQALAIDSDKTNRGNGKALLKHVENELKKINARILWLQTNKYFYEFYLNQGYYLVGIFKNYWGKYSDRYLLSKNL